MTLGEVSRCDWCAGDVLYEAYHDDEWGVPEYSDQKLFEMLNLEGAQAGLSWITVLRKRQHYRRVFDDFDAQKIAQYDELKRTELLNDPGIIRNKLKVNAFIVNARLYLDMQAQAAAGQGPTFAEFLWSFVDGKPIINYPLSMADVPATTEASDAMSQALKKRGFKFTGSTICYAFMQACGMVDDHVAHCHRRAN
jgi:DNA-3-methyladenine glycosylase I